jgi:uncharacterized protein (TIGR02145 family)
MKKAIKFFGVILILILISSCKKKTDPPSLTTKAITGITTISAISGGDISDDGGASIISKGVCWNTTDKPVVTDLKTTDSDGSGSFTSNISSLLPNTTYFVRAYATNSAGTSYGSSVSFKTLGDKPTPVAVNATDILKTSATLNGTVNPNSLSTTVSFEYGLTTAYGTTSVAVQSPLKGESNNNVTAALTGLTPGKLYHFRIKAENSLGISYSDDMSFTTLGGIPLVVSLKANNTLMYSATIGGSVNPNFFSTSIMFEWGTTTSYGNTINYSQNPVVGSAPQNISVNLTGLVQATTYHFRIKAENDLGIRLSDDFSFTTLGPVTDADGNVYQVITYGTQVWMSANLSTTKFNNGNDIPLVSDAAGWGNLTTPGYCWYDNNKDANKAIYGALYNFYTVNTGRLCPTGWHVPTNDEWGVLINYLTANGFGYEGSGDDIAKSLSSALYWQDFSTPGVVGNNQTSNNSSGFSAVPSGGRDGLNGTYTSIGFSTVYWTASPNGSNNALSMAISYILSRVVEGSTLNGFGGSVRCLNDKNK